MTSTDTIVNGGELARLVGVSPHTIARWVSLGLPVARARGAGRARRLRFWKRAALTWIRDDAFTYAASNNALETATLASANAADELGRANEGRRD
jgi:phage terminase Nu1 subunit (DNA packaging protein)